MFSGLKPDAAGNFFTTGSTSSGNPDYITTKIGSDGTLLWTRTYDSGGPDHPYAMTLDSAGNVYVTGEENPKDVASTVTVKYDSDGGEIWVTRYDSAAISVNSISASVAVDSQQNVFVVGGQWRPEPPYEQTFFTIKYDSQGDLRWIALYGTDASADSVALDTTGNIYVTGSVRDPEENVTSMATLKYATNNTFTGNSVTVPLYTGVSITFSEVLSQGDSGVTLTNSGEDPPALFELANSQLFYDITTTAIFSGPLNVCLTYDGATYSDESAIRLFHYENGSWVDITTTLDPLNHVICGTAQTLSPFAVFESTAVSLINDLVQHVLALNLRQGISNSLDAKLQTARAAVFADKNGDQLGACNRLRAFESEVSAQSGRQIPSGDGAMLTTKSSEIRHVLGCS